MVCKSDSRVHGNSKEMGLSPVDACSEPKSLFFLKPKQIGLAPQLNQVILPEQRLSESAIKK